MADFTESDSSNDEFQESGSRKTLASKVWTASFQVNSTDESPFGSLLGENPARNALKCKIVETYNLKDIEDDDLTKGLQDHACKFMRVLVGGLKFAART